MFTNYFTFVIIKQLRGEIKGRVSLEFYLSGIDLMVKSGQWMKFNSMGEEGLKMSAEKEAVE